MFQKLNDYFVRTKFSIRTDWKSFETGVLLFTNSERKKLIQYRISVSFGSITPFDNLAAVVTIRIISKKSIQSDYSFFK